MQAKFCGTCGAPLGAGHKFCPRCGAAVAHLAPPPQVAARRQGRPGQRWVVSGALILVAGVAVVVILFVAFRRTAPVAAPAPEVTPAQPTATPAVTEVPMLPMPNATQTRRPPPTAVALPGLTVSPQAATAPPQVVTATPAAQIPRIYDFSACLQPCDGSNAVTVLPEGTTRVYAQWKFENIPIGAHYVRTWTMNGQEWVRYDCTWPGPVTGMGQVTLREPGGLHSGTWVVTISVDNQVLLRGAVRVEGNWNYWAPAGVFNTCY